jgi:uncharacterized membrane protein YdjX (TVP38/TMEM64 family)
LNRKVKFGFVSLFLITTIVILALVFNSELKQLISLFTSPEKLRSTVDSYEPYGFLVLFILQISQVILAPLPGQVVTVAFGSIYGPYWGFILSLLGNFIATIMVIYIAKKFGRPAVKKLAGEKAIEKYEEYAGSSDVFPFIILVFMPGMSDDVVSYAAGLTSINSLRLITAISLARIPGLLVLAVFGDSLVKSQWNVLGVILFFVLIFGFFIAVKYQEINSYLSDKYGNGEEQKEE